MRNAFSRAVSILINMYKVLCTTTALAILLVLSDTADAYGSLRCKGRLIDVGHSAAAVLKLCGEPAKRMVMQVPARTGTRRGFTQFSGFVTSEQWVYERGYGKFPAVLHVEDGVIRRIDHLSRRSGHL